MRISYKIKPHQCQKEDQTADPAGPRRTYDKLYRSDFFPGLGWMLTKDLWEELRPKWPRAYWDDWMRQSEHRKGRQSIRPEVCRTFNFGEK
eukprot:scaffold185897_cov40-Prasinocladus_malaysianus.AAC.1